MAIAARRPSSTFSSEFDDFGLYALVRIVEEFVFQTGTPFQQD